MGDAIICVDRRTDVEKVIGAFHDYVLAPKENENIVRKFSYFMLTVINITNFFTLSP